MKFCIEMYFTLMNKANLRYLFTILAGERTQYFNPSCSAHWSHSHIIIFTLLMTIRNIFIHNRLWEVEGPRCTATVYVPSLIIKYLIWVWSLIEFPCESPCSESLEILSDNLDRAPLTINQLVKLRTSQRD